MASQKMRRYAWIGRSACLTGLVVLLCFAGLAGCSKEVNVDGQWELREDLMSADQPDFFQARSVLPRLAIENGKFSMRDPRDNTQSAICLIRKVNKDGGVHCITPTGKETYAGIYLDNGVLKLVEAGSSDTSIWIYTRHDDPERKVAETPNPQQDAGDTGPETPEGEGRASAQETPAERQAVPIGYTAHVRCMIGSMETHIITCLDKLTIRSNNRTHILDIMALSGGDLPRTAGGGLTLPLSEHFELAAFNKGQIKVSILEVVITDANGREVYQDQAGRYRGIRIRN